MVRRAGISRRLASATHEENRNPVRVASPSCRVPLFGCDPTMHHVGTTCQLGPLQQPATDTKTRVIPRISRPKVTFPREPTPRVPAPFWTLGRVIRRLPSPCAGGVHDHSVLRDWVVSDGGLGGGCYGGTGQTRRIFAQMGPFWGSDLGFPSKIPLYQIVVATTAGWYVPNNKMVANLDNQMVVFWHDREALERHIYRASSRDGGRDRAVGHDSRPAQTATQEGMEGQREPH